MADPGREVVARGVNQVDGAQGFILEEHRDGDYRAAQPFLAQRLAYGRLQPLVLVQLVADLHGFAAHGQAGQAAFQRQAAAYLGGFAAQAPAGQQVEPAGCFVHGKEDGGRGVGVAGDYV